MSADKKKAPELLSPAGNPEKLRYAVDYGADKENAEIEAGTYVG